MAYRNTVPLGQVGTGAAYILGPNLALQQWMGNVQQDQNRQFQAAQHNAAINRRNFESYGKGISSIPKAGRMYNTEIQQMVAAHTQDGAKLMSEGINPYAPNYNDPNQVEKATQFQRQQAELESYISAAQQIEKARDKALASWAEDPDSFDPDSYLEIEGYENKYSLGDVVSGKAPVPALRKTFDMGGFIKDNVGTPKTTVTEITKNPQGGYTETTVEEPNIEALANNVKSAFTQGEGANYLTRRLREAGIQGDARGVLGTVDRDEIRSFLDSEFRAPTANNPVAELMMNGRIPAIGSPEYNQFLDDAVEQQLRAERVADSVFNNAVQVAAGRTDTSYKVKPDFSYQREIDRQRTMQRQERALALSERKEARLRKESESGGGTQGTSYIGNSTVPVGIESRGTNALAPIRSSIGFDNTNVNMSGGDVYSLDTRSELRSGPSIRGSLVNLGEYPFDPSTGQLLDESQLSNVQNVEWRKMAHVRDEDYGDILVPAEKVPQTLSGPKKKVYDAFMSDGSGQTQSTTQTTTTTQFKGVPDGGF